MKKFLSNITGLIMVCALVYSCAKPEHILPNDENIIADFYASLDGDGRNRHFNSRISNDTVYVDIDYYYPIDSDNEVDLTKMLLRASIPTDAKISPSLEGYTDLTNPVHVTVTAGDGTSKDYVIVANKKGNTSVISAKLAFEDVSGVTQETDAIIIGNDINFSMVPGTVMNNPRMTYTLNRHAAGSITNGSTVNLSSPFTFTVTSAGDAKTNYKVQQVVASKLAKGIRPGSGKIMFVKKLKGDLGITVDNVTGGIAAAGKYLVINTRNENSIYIDGVTGQKVGAVELGEVRGNVRNFYSTSDKAGNVLINNLTANDGTTFKIWKLSSVTSSPELLISWDAKGAGYGRKVSVIGDITRDAIITAPLVGLASQNSFARWKITNGAVVSQDPEIVTINGYSWAWNNADVIYTNPTDVKSDYFVVGYGQNTLGKVNGNTNNVVNENGKLDGNFVCNAVDYIEFNNAKFAAYNHVNGFTWGSADNVFLYDAESAMSGNPGAVGAPGVLWKSTSGIYGANSNNGVVNGNTTGDVVMSTSENGYYMYLYFMFTNGCVVGVQFDCIDL
ncbi:DUF5018 domain-containing protein [Sphingobacterium composti Ten et al. 2007 non Yoo et al. 2007]|uniref:DUF5018 domain-containing protein n=1 Tax=Sphingobacterium composti TaxID=363260 RepID=UPI00135AC5D4|nr:DUF5018 domain-containing protein [Sphingobacterium composti Ten et al. 2007 non Yoo et al. 2007]